MANEPDNTDPVSSGNTPKQFRTAAELVALKDEVVRAMNVMDFYNSFLEGKKLDGRTKKGGFGKEQVHCCLHNDTGTPNLSVNLVTGAFKCFGCQKKGSIFDFWCYVHGREPSEGFTDALIALAEQTGVDISRERVLPTTPAEGGVLPTPLYQPEYKSGEKKAELNDAAKLPLKRKNLETYKKCLKEEHYKYLLFERGLKLPTIELFELAFNPNDKYKDKEDKWRHGRYLIPIPNRANELRNCRRYAVDAQPGMKMINVKGFGAPNRMFPLHILAKGKYNHIIWCEGELKCILLNQELWAAGFTDWIAMTGTAGAGSFEPEWMEDFEGKHVYIMLDVDQPGKNEAQKIANNFFKEALSTGKIKSLRIVHLPLAGTKDRKDVTDYFVKEGKKIEELMLLIYATPELELGGMNSEDLALPYTVVDDFCKVVKDRRYIDTRVRVPITITGQTTKTYHATREYKVSSCPLRGNGECCQPDGLVQIVPYGNPIFIESCMANKKTMEIALRQEACTKGQQCTVTETQKVVMEEHYASQRIERLTVIEDEEGRLVDSQELVTIPVYILQPEDGMYICPQDYIATGYIRSHPTTRNVCMFIEELETINDDWKDFSITPETIEHLKVIQDYKMTELLSDLSESVTHIYEANDILLTILLSYTCPLYINFNGSAMRGWINSCIIGDSGTGKTKTYQRISDWLELGDLFSTLSGSRTGLLYAIRSKGSDWYVQIGRYVLANGEIIAIDETQEMDADDIKKMAKAMDEGWLEVSRVASGGYRTATRTLFLMNPKYGKKISDFAYGCQALIDCFHPMFIRRLDIAIFSTGKNDPAFYNKEHRKSETKDVKITARIMKSLVHWAWTRKLDQVHWDSETTVECLEQSIRLAKIFGQADDVPLVNPQDFRLNLARLSTAYAVLSGSFTEDYQGVVIKKKHVKGIAAFIETVYSSSACNLKQHSKNSGTKKVLQDDDFPKIAEAFDKVIKQAEASRYAWFREGQHFLQLLVIISDQQGIKIRDAQAQLGVSNKWVQHHLTIISMFNLVEFKNGTYKATRKFNLFMQKWQESVKDTNGATVWDGERIERLLSEVHKKRGTYALIQSPEQIERMEEDDQQEPMEGLGGF